MSARCLSDAQKCEYKAPFCLLCFLFLFFFPFKPGVLFFSLLFHTGPEGPELEGKHKGIQQVYALSTPKEITRTTALRAQRGDLALACISRSFHEIWGVFQGKKISA